MNFLDEWHKQVKSFKWKNGLIKNPDFVHLDEIHSEIQAFFPAEDLTKGNIDPANWIAHILANQKIYSLYLVGEVAQLIKHYNTLPKKSTYNIKAIDGRINYREFNEKLFELYVSYILTRSGLTPIIGENYLSRDGNQKQIDILLKVNNNDYNVEITKFYDSFAEGLTDMGLEVTRFLESKFRPKGIRPDEVFAGYIGFKTAHISLIAKAKQVLKDSFKAHFHSFRSNSKIIRAVPTITTDEYEINIKPAYFFKENEVDEKVKQFPYYISFSVGPFALTGRARFNLKGNLSGNTKSKNLLLLEKVKEKIKQHRDFTGMKLIVVGIDNIMSTHKKGSIPPIRYEDIDVDLIKSALSINHLVLLIFKEATDDNRSIRARIIGDFEYHKEIMEYLKRLEFGVTYIP